MSNAKSLIGCAGLFYLFFAIVVGTGWVMNINKLSKCDFKEPYKAEIIHSIGIIPLVGMVTGWMDIGK
ncbi:MAG: hypothetical protein GQ540_03975 [Lutibacter sp.]|uniref:hypothetical protein n=1 Tax=Lutibacter sp. TaxID=1925666 RepID=UPI001A0EEA13|nr:hypothetical protein [Lutibacter sp.]NOR27672.1 hypothetical protein [Lutibacter sp.]